MKQGQDQNASITPSAPPAANWPVLALGVSDGEKPQGWACSVRFARLLLPKNGRAILSCLVFLGISAFYSCNPNALSSDDFLRWMAEHRAELTASKQQGYITSTVTYLPPDWLAVNEIGNQDPKQIATARKEYEGLEYYRLRLAASSGEGDVLQLQATSTDDYYQRVEYFSFGLQNDLRMLVGPDTLPCQLFHFERNYGAAPYMDFMLGFEQKEGKDFDRTLIYYDRVYSGSTLQLTIPINKIKSVPNLKL